GDQNDFIIVADTESVALQDIPVFLYDDGTITNGSATAFYDSANRRLLLNVQSGVTTAATLIATINSGPHSEGIPFTASLAPGNDGSGVFNILPQEFFAGTDPVPATATTTLPNGVVVVLETEVGGTANNGIKVSFAIDTSLTLEA